LHQQATALDAFDEGQPLENTYSKATAAIQTKVKLNLCALQAMLI
jgi:hypothetical protein